MTPEETRIQKARALRYKRAMVYGYLDAELCVLTAECKANQKVTEEICNLYDLIMNDYHDRDTERKFEKIVSSLPDRAWVE